MRPNALIYGVLDHSLHHLHTIPPVGRGLVVVGMVGWGGGAGVCGSEVGVTECLGSCMIVYLGVRGEGWNEVGVVHIQGPKECSYSE